jgi:hypothetical protein
MSDDSFDEKPGFTRRDLVRGALVGAVAAGVGGKVAAAPPVAKGPAPFALELTINGKAARADRRAARAPSRRAARAPRPDRHQGGLWARRLRGVYGPGGRTDPVLLPAARRRSRREIDHDNRGGGRGWPPFPDSGGLHSSRRAPVRLLHLWNGDVLQGSSRPPSAPLPGPDRGRLGRQPLPVRDLSACLRRRRTSGGNPDRGRPTARVGRLRRVPSSVPLCEAALRCAARESRVPAGIGRSPRRGSRRLGRARGGVR